MTRRFSPLVVAYAEAQLARLSQPRPVRAGWHFEEGDLDRPDRWVNDETGCVITDHDWDGPMTICSRDGACRTVTSPGAYRRIVDWLEGRS